MTVKWVNSYYDLQLKKGLRVGFKVMDEVHYGTITSATHRVFVKPDNLKKMRLQFHPRDIIILENGCDS